MAMLVQMLIKLSDSFLIYLLLLHPFSLSCGVDVSYEKPPLNPVLRASYPDSFLSDKSFLMLSNHLRFGLPLLLFPGTSITITLFQTFCEYLMSVIHVHSKMVKINYVITINELNN